MTDVNTPRRAKAAQTRARIIEAAHAEFLEKGFHGATIAAVAKRASVASQTVYFVFHNKVDLISAVIDQAVMGDTDLPPQLTDWWQAMVAEPDAAESLKIFARGAADAFERAAPISLVLAAAALTDDDLRARHQAHEQLRRTAFREVIETVAPKGNLATGLDLDQGTDVLLTVFSDATYAALRTDRGWSQQQVVNWFAHALPTLLLEH